MDLKASDHDFIFCSRAPEMSGHLTSLITGPCSVITRELEYPLLT